MKEFVDVANKSAGTVIYNIKEDGIRRSFAPRELKRDIPVKELSKLVQQPGGPMMLRDYLQVQDSEVINYLLNGNVEPEYWLKEADIPNWLQTCSLDELKDALDFAPLGTKDLIKGYAVKLPLNDHSKREAIKEQLGFDVTKAIELSAKDADEEEEKKEVKQRRVMTAEGQPNRRVVVKPQE